MGYSSYLAVTIDHTKVPSTQSNFPVLVSLTEATLKTVANGGAVTNSNGYDIVAATSPGGSTLLAFEREFYDPTTGQIVFWVKISSVSSSVDTVFYIPYGNAAITTDQSAPNSVWDTNFKGVYHFPNGTTLSAVDSTSNGRNGTILSAIAGAGKIDGGAGTGVGRIEISDTGLPSGAAARTVEAWIKTTGQVTVDHRDYFAYGTAGSNLEADVYGILASTHAVLDGHWTGDADGTVVVDDTNWHYVAVTTDGSGNVLIYVDGNLDTSTNIPGINTTLTGTAYINAKIDSLATSFPGTTDELRISAIARTADWLKTCYNNQNSPSTFYSYTVNSNTVLTASVFDSVSVSESTAAKASIFVSDAVPVSENASAALANLRFGVSRSEAISVSDVASPSLFTVFVKDSVSDSVRVRESAVPAFKNARYSTLGVDSAGISENVQVNFFDTRIKLSVSESISAKEAIGRILAGQAKPQPGGQDPGGFILTITIGGRQFDYTSYVDWRTIKISEQINIPSTMTFTVTGRGAQFLAPVQRGYIKLYSLQKSRSLFTGYISSVPAKRFLGLGPDALPQTQGQVLAYDCICTSDEHLLNIKAVPFIPAFINRTQGEILTDLAETLAPGFFDTSLVMSGDIVPYYSYNPQESFSEIAKKFADGVRYRYKVRDKQIVYVPYGDQALGVEYDEVRQKQSQFDPRGLQTTVLSVPTVNDVTIIGDAEAGNTRNDYFIGDGFTGNFPLRHKVFRGSSSVLLQESWTSTQLNTQQWFLLDPDTNFDTTAGALNLITSRSQRFTLGNSYLAMNNGIELAGGISLDHGEFTWNDYSSGVLGGVYTDSSYLPGTLIGGFVVTSPDDVVTTASGAIGVRMQPWWNSSGASVSPTGTVVTPMSVDGQPGYAIGTPIISRANHTYVLQTLITAPRYTRYNRLYRTTEGEQFGGNSVSVSGSATFVIYDIDIAASTGAFYTPASTKVTVDVVDLPDFAAYALVNNQVLNFTADNTTLSLMPLGALETDVTVSGFVFPTGGILPALPPGSGGYVGPVPSWPSSASANILPPPLPVIGPEFEFMGADSLQIQAVAQINPGNEADILAFYGGLNPTIPAAGIPVHLRSWESQAAVSRVQDPISIGKEAFIVGDDGIRSAIVPDLNPLPRTSEDCDNAALAFLKDRTKVFYNGQYDCTSLFFQGLNTDLQFWPTCGRFFHVNAPQRGIVDQKYLVVKLDISILEPASELLQLTIGFGADLYLEKVLKNFVDLQPPEVLTPKDKANPPNPRYDINVGTSFLPDLNHVSVTQITDTNAVVEIADITTFGTEVRKIDARWGTGPSSDYVGTFFGQTFVLDRQSFDQTWFMRPVVSGIWVTGGTPGGSGMIGGSGGLTSRRSTAIRIRYPQRPSLPNLISTSPPSLDFDGGFQFDFNGDQRSIYGFELRMYDNQTVLVQKPALSYADLNIDLTTTPYTFLLGTPSLTGSQASGQLFAYFFNHQWSYSEPLVVEVPSRAFLGNPIATWAVGVGGPQIPGTDISNPILVRVASTATEVAVRTSVIPAQDITFDILVSKDYGLTWTSILAPNPLAKIPANSTDQWIYPDLAIRQLAIGDWLRLDQLSGISQKCTVELIGEGSIS